MNEEEKKIHARAECPVCFENRLVELEYDPQVIHPKVMPVACDFCRARPWLQSNGREHLRRMLEVMPRASLARIPEVLKVMASGLYWAGE